MDQNIAYIYILFNTITRVSNNGSNRKKWIKCQFFAIITKPLAFDFNWNNCNGKCRISALRKSWELYLLLLNQRRYLSIDIRTMLDWQPAFKLKHLFKLQMPIACELFLESAQGALIWPFLKMHRVRPFSFTLTIYFYRHAWSVLCIYQTQRKAWAIARLVAFTLLYFNIIKLNAFGSKPHAES